MPAEIVKQRVSSTNLDRASKTELIYLINALTDGIRAISVKLDADAGVTDTNYTAALDAIVTK